MCEKHLKYKALYLDAQERLVQAGGKRGHRKRHGKGNNAGPKEKPTLVNKNDVSGVKSDYVETLSEPWFTLISLGLKTVEGRKNKGRFKEMKVGDVVEWVNYSFKARSVKTKVVAKNTYSTFEEYLTAEGLDKCLPGMPTIEHGLSVYFKYFTKEDEKTYGVVSIALEVL